MSKRVYYTCVKMCGRCENVRLPISARVSKAVSYKCNKACGRCVECVWRWRVYDYLSQQESVRRFLTSAIRLVKDVWNVCGGGGCTTTYLSKSE